MISVRGAILSSCVIYIKEENKKISFQDLVDSIVMEITSVIEMN